MIGRLVFSAFISQLKITILVMHHYMPLSHSRLADISQHPSVVMFSL
jgi:hypothetical protein